MITILKRCLKIKIAEKNELGHLGHRINRLERKQ